MYRVDNATAIAVMPTPGAVGPNPNGYFTAPNAMESIPGTELPADFMNAVQEEICAVIEEAEITLSKTTHNQLLTAIQTLITNALNTSAWSWSVITVDQTLVKRTGVVTNSGATTLNLTLPTTAAVGDLFKVARFNGDFIIKQNSGQAIYFGSASTTPGTGGSISPNANNASVDLLCVTSNTTFLVVNSQGAFTVI